MASAKTKKTNLFAEKTLWWCVVIKLISQTTTSCDDLAIKI